MTKQELIDYMNTGNEIEFSYKKKRYSVTYFHEEGNSDWISFCEFYQDPDEFSSIDEFLDQATLGEKKLVDRLDEITQVDIY
jgi:hypothetical protein